MLIIPKLKLLNDDNTAMAPKLLKIIKKFYFRSAKDGKMNREQCIDFYKKCTGDSCT